MCDVCRKVRESRQELRKYMREVKKNCPSTVCTLQYDKLYVNHRPVTSLLLDIPSHFG